jgi:DNA-binding CsgD family transcriptional regulator
MAVGLDRPVVCPVLIGRETQLAALDELLSAAAGGVGQALLVAGEAGVGKSRLVAEAKARAVERGFLILQGNCFQPDGACPYAPLLDLLRTHLGGKAPAAVAAELGASAPALAPLLPDLLPAPEPGRGVALDPEQEKRRLFVALAGFVAGQAARGPVLLVVEDIHWSDATSLEFLLHLLRRAPSQRLLTLLTYRHDEAPPAMRHWLAGVDRERLAQELTLAPLARDEIDRMVRAIFGLPQPARAEFLATIYGLTQGNPFFVEEVLKSLVAAGEVVYRDGAWARKPIGRLRIPRSVHAAVQGRLERLSEPARRLASVAAVAGRRFDFALIQTVTGVDEGDLLRLIRELIAAQLVAEETADQFAFRHALTRQAIYDELLARERRALHGAVAEALERAAPDAVELRVADLAYHAAEAGRWAQALEYGRRAAERARLLYTPAAVVEHADRALEAARQLGTPPPIDLLRARGQARETLGDFAAAEADFAATLASARAAGDRPAEWQALLDLGFLWTSRDYDRARDELERALALARTLDDPATLAHSLNRIGNWRANQEEAEPAVRFHQEALAIFERLGDRPGLAATWDLLSMAHSLGGDLVSAGRAGRRAEDLFRALGDRQGLVASLVGGATIPGAAHEVTVMAGGAGAGDLIDRCEAALALAREIGWRTGEAFVLALLSECHAATGDFGPALAAARGGLAVAEELEHHQWMAQAHCVSASLHLELLDLPAARSHAERTLALGQAVRSRMWTNSASGLLASVLVRQGELAAAEAVLGRVLDPATPMRAQGQRHAWCARAELALARGDPAAALAILDRLFATALNLTDEADIPRLAALKAQALAALGEPDPAEALLRAALATAAAWDARPMRWRFHAALGAHCRRQGRVEEAGREEAAARRLIDELAGAIPDDELRESFRRQAMAMLPADPSVARRAARQTVDGLTRREREVAGLIAQGKTNREIAALLYVGERTIETHVSNILTKLDFATRAQIAAWAATRGQGRGVRG